ncbi:hypothetical protein GC169_02275 [bacterium]|nr:hypothetical protein [bacterium]
MTSAPPSVPASEPLRVLTWNIGYGGLGEESDFIAEGGKRLRPPSRAVVEKNVAGVASILAREAPPVVFVQEAAGRGLLTRNVDVADGVRRALPRHRMVFAPDVASRLWPGDLRLVHGPAVLIEVRPGSTTVLDLPDEPRALAGLVPRNYRAIETDLDVSGRPWTLINVHLAAYESSGVREWQLAAVLTHGAARAAEGRAVIIGGDFNLSLVEVSGGEDADARPFPKDLLPRGWQIVSDGRATVRSKEGPWRPGVSRTSTIDGFIVSPNVRVRSVETLDEGFRYSDHQPVEGVFERMD